MENIEIMDHKESVISILIANWDDYCSFLDSFHSDCFYELKMTGLVKIVNNDDQYQSINGCIIEKFLDEQDLWIDLQTEIREHEEQKEIQLVNS